MTDVNSSITTLPGFSQSTRARSARNFSPFERTWYGRSQAARYELNSEHELWTSICMFLDDHDLYFVAGGRELVEHAFLMLLVIAFNDHAELTLIIEGGVVKIRNIPIESGKLLTRKRAD